MASVLYSCFGTTDPVRGMRDGGLMHILRFERPTAVYLFLSKEIVELDKKDGRIAKAFAHMRDAWGGYAPEVIRVETEIEDPSDMDILLDPMTALVDRMHREQPGARYLFNLSSGTPQMQIILSQMAMDSRFPDTVGIQVKNPEQASGREARTNTRTFSIEDALETNIDDEEDAPNRCVVPQMLAIRREAVKNEVKSLLEQRNYAAIAKMKAELPDTVTRLARHLDYRSHFLLEEAKKAAKGLEGYGLQAEGAFLTRNAYELVEYFTMLKHLVHLKRYTDFILRLNPFLVRLQQELLAPLLKKQGLRKENLFGTKGAELMVERWRLEEQAPGLLAYMEADFGKLIKDSAPASVVVLNQMLSYYKADSEALTILRKCEKCNQELRNTVAHNLYSITNEDIKATCGSKAEELVLQLERVLVQAAASPRDKDNRQLKEQLSVYGRCDRRMQELCGLLPS